MPDRIMAHMVAFYPDRESSIEVARALIDGGCNYLEVQFPFSDPTADGAYIQKACM
ncbi:MAG: tryptophan synthase subunit alpha [Spirochaetes bacterium]|nr:tryptophan synthase subunit alpha [Spirochaetota bacterium]